MERLSNKVALVTGAAAGIGEAICRRFCAEGAAVLGLDCDAANVARVTAEVCAAGGKMHAFVGDVICEEDCVLAVREANEHLGAVQVLCNVAGVVDVGTLPEATEASWRRAWEVNMGSVYRLCKCVVPQLARAGGGSVINIASVAGPFAVRERGVYSASKAGVIGITKSLAIDYISQGVRVNAICPGTIETPSWHERVRQAADPQQALRDFIARQPIGRVGRAEEVAALAAYLAADESAYMTGQALYLDGGMTI